MNLIFAVRQVCQTLDRIASNIRANNGTHPSAPHPSTEYDISEPNIELPELIDISEGGRDATMEDILTPMELYITLDLT